MKTYSGWNWLLIDAANQMGHDKWLFEERIQWATEHLTVLESMADQADCKPLYLKAVMAIRKAQAGQPTGHLVGLDAVCSGIQCMSALTGCIEGARATGLVDPDVRADAYTQTTAVMNTILGGGLDVSRADAKRCLMTSFYGSKKVPKEVFGEDTPELSAFYQAAQTVAPGAWELLQDLLASWQPYALSHDWKLPDGYDAHVLVMNKIETRIEVDELDHATFSYEYYVNEGNKTGLSLVANVTHSVDAYILRCMHRRCNYERQVVEAALNYINTELVLRDECGAPAMVPSEGSKLEYYVNQYKRSGMADVVILPYITRANACMLSTRHAMALQSIINSMLSHKPFELVTVHDEFKSLAGNCNQMRQHYINIFAELAESNLLDDLLSQINGKPCQFTKLSSNLGSLIRGSNYALS